MELNIQRQPIAACELLLAATAEHPIECDALLPDYCPDIVRVLSCQAAGTVTDASVRGANLLVDGMATVTLCYLGEIGGVRRTEYRLPFSHTFSLPSEPKDPVFTVTAEQGYLNCRAVSRRRLDIRGTLLLSARVCDNECCQAVCGASGAGIQLKLDQTSGVRLGEQTLRRFSLREELSPPLGKSPVAELVRADCRAVVQDCRVTAGRAVLKGELLLHLLYKTDLETGALEAADYTLPISQLLDLDGVGDETRCEAELSCEALECTPDDDGGEGKLLVEAQMIAALRFFHPVELVGAADSYSTLYLSDTQTQQLKVPRLIGAVSERVPVKEQLARPDGLDTILDVWATPGKASARFEDGVMTARCQLVFSVLGSIEDLGIDCFSHSCEVKVPLPLADADEHSELTPRFSVLSAGGSLSGDVLSLSCELLVCGTVLGYETKKIITGLSVDENAPRKADPAIGLMICYALPGESVWEIAKRYGARMEQVMADNGLTAEVIEKPTALIIPVAQSV